MVKLHQILVVMVLLSVVSLQVGAQPAPAPYLRGYPAPSPYAYAPETYPVPAPAYSPYYEAPAYSPGPVSGA